MQATFESANGLRPDSPVRIAGVNVGKVVKVDAEEGTDNAVVTMEINDEGRPIGTDATAKIRPRIFLEGNFFVDLQPGTPGAEELDDGGMLTVTQTATPVQLDQVLTALQSDTRQDLQDVIDGLGSALSDEPTAEDDAQADPSARGETAAESFNDAYEDIGPAEKAQAQVNEAFLGTEPEQDLGRLVRGLARTQRRPGPQRGPAQGPRDQLQRDDGRARLRERQPAGVHPRAAGHARGGQRGVRRRSTPRSRRRAPSRARSFPASARRPRRSTRPSRGSPRPPR